MLTGYSQSKQLAGPNAAYWALNPAKPLPQPILVSYEAVSLKQMGRVALMNRTDTKYVMSVNELWVALHHLAGDYRILEIGGMRFHHYQTLYFDTADFALYKRHHAGAANRCKVRSRAYIDSGLYFLEVKHKTNKERTIKDRMETSEILTQIDQESAEFLQEFYPYEVAELLPVLGNTFTRITLVSKQRKERLTLDFELAFRHGGQEVDLPVLAIAEVKQEGFSNDSDFIQQMRHMGVRPTSFSKYCLGVNHLYPHLKQNNFKPRHLLIQKLSQGCQHGYTH